MSKHPHAEMIKAKADNMELVVLVKYDEGWALSGYEELICLPDREFFLCLPQHKEACLHWLNGGDAEVNVIGEWLEIKHYSTWDDASSFMDDRFDIRIKPRKEKLWLAVKTDKHEHLGGCRKVRICSHAFVNKQDAEDYLDLSDSQLIEIEVEV